MSRIFAMSVVVASLTLVGPGLAEAPEKNVGLEVGQIAPDWTLKDPKGEKHSLSDYRGEIVMMDFWATWCGPCLEAMPHLQEIHEEYEKRGVNVLGIDVWDDGDPASFMEDNDYTYTLLLKGDPVAEQYNVTGIPTFYMIGFDGEIIYKQRGYHKRLKKDIVEELEAYLETHQG